MRHREVQQVAQGHTAGEPHFKKGVAAWRVSSAGSQTDIGSEKSNLPTIPPKDTVMSFPPLSGCHPEVSLPYSRRSSGDEIKINKQAYINTL